jgi:chitinase
MHIRKTSMKVLWFTSLAIWILACSAPAYLLGTATSSPEATLTPAASGTLTVSPGLTTTPPSSGAPRLIGYFYGQDRYNLISDIPSGKLTDLIYAFITISDAGECVSIDPSRDAVNFPALQQLKQQNPGLHILVSIGGYAHSAKFSDAAVSDTSRRALAQSCVQYMALNGFDGIDIDWETPVSGGLAGNSQRPEDKQNYTLLLAELRKQLDAQGKKDGRSYRLSAAMPAGPNQLTHFEINKIFPYVDWITVMAYAIYTSASPITNFNAPLYPTSTDPATDEKRRLLYNGDAAVKAYLAAGVPAEKIALGVPFYGRAWKGVPSDNHGLYQTNTGPFVDDRVPKGTWSSEGEITFKALEQYYLGSWKRYWQPEAQEPWLYDASSQVMVTYDDAQSLGAKADYVKSRQLGGISIWQVSGDDDQHTLINALYSHLQP